MDELHLKAYGLLAEGLFLHAYGWAKSDDKWSRGDERYKHAPWPLYYNYSTSNLEAVTEALVRLRILNPLNEISSICSFACELREVRGRAAENWKEGLTFEELMRVFIDVFGDFGTDYWGLATAPNALILPRQELVDLFESLTELGLTRKQANAYYWTDLVAPIMRHTYHYAEWFGEEEL
jgi:hypothetical protein